MLVNASRKPPTNQTKKIIKNIFKRTGQRWQTGEELFPQLTLLNAYFLEQNPQFRDDFFLQYELSQLTRTRTCADSDVVETKFYIFSNSPPFEIAVVLTSFGEFFF